MRRERWNNLACRTGCKSHPLVHPFTVPFIKQSCQLTLADNINNNLGLRGPTVTLLVTSHFRLNCSNFGNWV